MGSDKKTPPQPTDNFVNKVDRDEVRLKLEKWREEKRNKADNTVQPNNGNTRKRFRIGQTPPPLPKSVKKRNPIRSRIDCHWKKRISTGSTTTSNKRDQNLATGAIKENNPVKKSTVESRRLTTVIKPGNRNSTQSNRAVLAVKPIVSNITNNKKTSSKDGSRRTSSTCNKNRTSQLNNKSLHKPSIKTTTSRRHSLRTTKTLKNIPSTPMSVSKRRKLTNDNSEESVLAWRIDATPPNHVRFNTARRSTPHSKTVLAQARKGKDASMRNTLKNWLDSNGKTPSKFRHLMCFDAEMSAKKVNTVPPSRTSITVAELTQQHEAMLKENNVDDVFIDDESTNQQDDKLDQQDDKLDQQDDKLDQQDDKLDQQILSMLDECFTLFLAGFSADAILPWLDKIERFSPHVKEYTPFYICKLNVVKSTGNKQQVLDVIHDSILHSAKPADKLAQAVKSTLEELLSENESCQPVESPEKMKNNNIFNSTTIKYSLKQVTPFTSARKRKRHTENEKFSPRAVVTPVRRSTRRSLSVFKSDKENQVYTSIQDIPDNQRTKALFHENMALEDVLQV